MIQCTILPFRSHHNPVGGSVVPVLLRLLLESFANSRAFGLRPRIVNVASVAHFTATGRRDWKDPWGNYCGTHVRTRTVPDEQLVMFKVVCQLSHERTRHCRIKVGQRGDDV